MKLLKFSKGFTMIELLIVIAVLGILAVAVLAAINPIEQINRGRDTGSRSDAEQLISAIDRYYTAQNWYPWQSTATSPDPVSFRVVDNTWVDDTTSTEVLSKLSSGGTQELKQSFVSRVTAVGYNALQVYFQGGNGDSVYVCFLPKSGSFLEEATQRCTGVKGSIPADLEPISASDICADVSNSYICLP